MNQTTGARTRRTGRRGSARRAAPAVEGGPVALQQQAPGQARLPFEPTRAVSDDELESLHLAALQVLTLVQGCWLTLDAHEPQKTRREAVLRAVTRLIDNTEQD